MVQLAEKVESVAKVKVTDEDIVHVSPGTLAGAFLRQFWHPVYCGDDLPVGVPKPIRILGEDFTLYRGESGAAHVLGFRCAHRGNQLSLGWVEGDSIRCYYHGWRYDASGQCDRQPHEEHSFCQKIKVPSYPVQEYVGLIFLYIGPEPVPELPRYPAMEREDYVIDAEVKVLPYNYFQSLENNLDPGHVPFVHRRFHRAPYVENGDDIESTTIRVRETESGIECVSAHTHRGAQEHVMHVLMPNIHCLILPPNRGSGSDEWRPHYSWRTPIDDEHTLWFNSAAEPAAAHQSVAHEPSPEIEPFARRVLAGIDRIHEIEKGPYVTNIQDYVSQWGQGTIVDRSHDHLGKSDAGVILLRQVYKRELQKLAEGKPLKDWTGRGEAVSTSY